MEYKKININTNVSVTEQDVSDILCTAFFGGINYWCLRIEAVGDLPEDDRDYEDRLAEHLFKGGEILIYEDENETGELKYCNKRILTLDKLLDGIKYLIEEYSTACVITERYSMALECGNIDAEDADIIIQRACLGEVVYG